MFDHPPKVCIVRLAYGGHEHVAVGEFLARTVYTIARDPRCSHEICQVAITDRQVHLARNLAVEIARQNRADLLLMIDADQIPDCEPGAPPFFDAALEHMIIAPGPCVVAAPTPMLNNRVNIHDEVEDNQGKHLRLLSLEEVADREGMEQVPAAGTGLIMIDCRVFDLLAPPYFRFVYDPALTQVVAGEDVCFTADCGGPGVPVFASWSTWSAHSKTVTLGRPKKKSPLIVAGH